MSRESVAFMILIVQSNVIVIQGASMADHSAFVLENARLVLADDVVDGWVAVERGCIREIGHGHAPERGIDFGGDYLLPGLVELHTDHLEPHAMPRPGVHWDPEAAVLAYDRQIIGSGITTVFDSLRIGATAEDDATAGKFGDLAKAIAAMQARELLCADHLTHLRCEVATPDVVSGAAAFLAERPAHLISLMDHTPGQRQFRDLDKMRQYHARHVGFRDDGAFQAFLDHRLAMHANFAERQRRGLVALARRHAIALASHDDATPEHVEEALADDVAIAEFPTTAEAAAASHAAGIKVLMGAPNLVRGGSHSGNVAAVDLAAANTLDILSSDYVPSSLMMAAFDLPERVPSFSLADAVRLVSKHPAEATGLTDRGEIAPGKRADMVRVRARGHAPATLMVWRGGNRVA